MVPLHPSKYHINQFIDKLENGNRNDLQRF